MTSVHYTTTGAGPVVVLLHGGTGSSETYWAGQTQELSRDFTLILMDHRGFGKSDTVGEFSIEACAADVLAVLDERDVDQADLVGLSLGGAIAMQTALLAPSRVRRLVLADTFSRVATERFRRFIDYALIGALRHGGIGLMSDINLIFAHGEQYLFDHAKDLRHAEETWSQQQVDRYVQALERIRDWDIDERLADIIAPSLIVWGSDDIEVPRVYAERLANALPNALLTVIAGAGHKSCTDQPDMFNKLVRTFLSPA